MSTEQQNTIAAYDLLLQAMQAAKESEFTFLLQIACKLDNSIQPNVIRMQYMTQWLEQTKQNRSAPRE